MNKWRCHICNNTLNKKEDLCSHCGVSNSYVLEGVFSKEELIKVWIEFCKNKYFMLNPDKEHVNMIADGVLINEKKYGLKLCPCRLRDGTKKMDEELICPCNFFKQVVWREQKRCWCGLFVKRE